MRVVVITAPDPVVTWDDLDVHLKLSGDKTDQTYIQGLAAAATAHIDGPDGWLGRAIGQQVLEARFDTCEVGGDLRLPFPPVIDLVSIGWTGADRLPVDGDVTSVDLFGADVVPAFTPPWSGMLVGREALRIRYKAGYEAVPAPIRAAILLMVGDLYRFRDTVVVNGRSETVAMSTTVENLLTPFRVY